MKVGKFVSFLMMRILTILFILFSQALCARQYFFTNYTSEQGLSNNSVNCMVKDREGFLWVGTESGLNRFNGYDFTVYKSLANDSSTLPSNVIRRLVIDRKGTLWIGTGQGICRYERSRDAFIRLCIKSGSDSVCKFECHSLFEDSKGNLWAGGPGLLKYIAGKKCFVPVLGKLPVSANNSVMSITEDADGSLWLLNYSHLLHYNPVTGDYREYENKILNSGNSRFQGMDVFRDPGRTNYLWLSSWGSGLIQFNKQVGTFLSYKFNPGGSPNLDNLLFDISFHESNKLWLATNRGLILFDPEKKQFGETFRDSTHENAVVNCQSRRIYSEADGEIWIGTGCGLAYINPSKQHFISQPLWLNAPVSDYYYDETADKLYGVRIYSHRSLYIYDRKTNRTEIYPVPQADENRTEPFAVIKDDHGLVWIGTSKGIYTFDESRQLFSLFDIEKQLHRPNRSLFVRQALKDSIGNLWFSCYSKGLLFVDGNSRKITSYFHDDTGPGGFPLFAITGVSPGSGKTIYACDEQNGVVKLDYGNGELVHFNAKEKKYSLLFDATDIAVDSKKRIWVTTRNNGLVCINARHEATAYTRDDLGKIIDEQGTLAIDNEGKVWFTATNGLFNFSPEEKSFTNYTIHDGLPMQTAPLLRLGGGTFATRSNNDIFTFDPLKISKAGKPLPIHLVSLKVNGNEVAHPLIDGLDTVTFSHLENNLSIEFAAIDFGNPAATQYSYMLKGIHDSWSMPSLARTVNFSQLPPGNYQLLLRTTRQGPQKSLHIIIVPAWWQTTWFRWTIAIGILATVASLIRLFYLFRFRQQIARLEKQREIEAIRSRISRDIHDEIGAGLTKIKLMSRNLSKKSSSAPAMSDLTQKISASSEELIQNLGEIVWTINPSNDTLENIVAFMRNYVSKLFEEYPEITLRLQLPEPSDISPGGMVNPEIKRNLILIMKEILTNVMKHSRATEVAVVLQLEKSKIVLEICDNGTGMAEKRNELGNGMINMRKRAENVRAELGVESIPGKGTTIRLMIPLAGAT